MTQLVFVPVDDVDAGDLDQRILSFRFVDDEKKTAQVTIVVNNPDRRFHESELWRPGTMYDVTWGTNGLSSPRRRVVVAKKGMTGPLGKFSVPLQEVGVLLNTEPRGTKRFDDTRHSDVSRILAQENGFTDDYIHITDTTKVYPSITRTAAETDAVFMVRLATYERDFHFWVDHRGWHWGPRDLEQTPTANLGLGDILGDVTINQIKPDRPARVRHASRDSTLKKNFRATVDNVIDTVRPGLAPIMGVGTGLATVAEAYGIDTAALLNVGRAIISAPPRRTSVRVDPETGSETTVYVDTPVTTTPEERLAGTRVERSSRAGDDDEKAKRSFRDAQMGAISITVKVRGNPYLLAKRVVSIDIGDQKLSGRYWIRSSTHVLRDGSNGYTTTLKLISDGHGGHSTRGTTSFPLGRTRGSRTRISQNFESASRLLENLIVTTSSSALFNVDFQSVFRDLAQDIRRVSAKRPGSIDRAQRTVDRLRTTAVSTGNTQLAKSAALALSRLGEARRGETSSSARVVESKTDTDQLEKVVSVDPETGNEVIRYRERSGR